MTQSSKCTKKFPSSKKLCSYNIFKYGASRQIHRRHSSQEEENMGYIAKNRNEKDMDMKERRKSIDFEKPNARPTRAHTVANV